MSPGPRWTAARLIHCLNQRVWWLHDQLRMPSHAHCALAWHQQEPHAYLSHSTFPPSHLSTFQPFTTAIVGGQLRPYQLESLQFFSRLYRHGVSGGILADEMVCALSVECLSSVCEVCLSVECVCLRVCVCGRLSVCMFMCVELPLIRTSDAWFRVSHTHARAHT